MYQKNRPNTFFISTADSRAFLDIVDVLSNTIDVTLTDKLAHLVHLICYMFDETNNGIRRRSKICRLTFLARALINTR